jgi:RNA polymerase sigma-70 factor (ECF subfamily)
MDDLENLRAWLTTVVGRLSLERKRQRGGHEMRGAPGIVNGLLGFVCCEGKNLNVLSLTTDAGRIVALDVVRNPDKLRHEKLPG